MQLTRLHHRMVNAREGASPARLDEIERELRVTFPARYRDLLLAADGYFLTPTTLVYGTAELVERNAAWETKDYAPGFLAVGDSSGPDVILLVLGQDDPPVYVVDAGAMVPECMECVATSLTDWVAKGCPLKAA